MISTKEEYIVVSVVMTSTCFFFFLLLCLSPNEKTIHCDDKRAVTSTCRVVLDRIGEYILDRANRHKSWMKRQ